MAVAARLPVIIQGGMGVAVSSWRLARAVSSSGQLGVVSGTALDLVLARRLQDGDPGGHARRALAAFPDQEVVAQVLARFLRPDGRPEGTPYRPVPKLSLHGGRDAQVLTALGNFVEVWLAKEGHDRPVGVNYLEKVQLATPAAALGAMAAGVDVVIMGAGVPREIPRLLTDLAEGRVGGVSVDVVGDERAHRVEVDPATLFASPLSGLRRPAFLAIVSASALAAYLARDEVTRPDGFVVEGPPAGGHNAPPRGRLELDGTGQPVYGPRDEVDLTRIAAIGLPFWVAGSHGTPARVREARAAGAAGVQVGTVFALAEESGLTPALRDQARTELATGGLEVRTDPAASPTGFPFKVAQLEGTLSDPQVYDERPRLCDLGYLRTPYRTPSGGVGYRCPSEPLDEYVRKGGDVSETVGRACLCNSLSTNVGLGQTRRDGYAEPALLTLGADLDGAATLAAAHPQGWRARDVVDWLTGSVEAPARLPAVP